MSRGSDAEPFGGESSAEQAEGGLLSWVPMVSGALSPFEGDGIRDMPGLHFSQRGGFLGGLTPSSAAPASQPAPSEPRHSTTRDVGSSDSDSGSASDSDSKAEEASESDVDGPAHSSDNSDGGLTDRGNKLSLFAPRKRSEDNRNLPLTVEKGMMELKVDLWGEEGVHKNARRSARKEWRRAFLAEAHQHRQIVRWRQNFAGTHVCATPNVLQKLIIHVLCCLQRMRCCVCTDHAWSLQHVHLWERGPTRRVLNQLHANVT